uniref:G-protein coupled receptors family 1 profile domain-containing protein n=1 Tax=Daphnia galeata TaxID=27404 RepID=A0A8J2WAI7_9CRUS|nr:unnamed protein product [Daphnia galeata]
MAIPATTNISANVSDAVLLGIVLDIVKEQWNQSDLMGDVLLSNSSINKNTDVELVNLLMPIWAYQSAAVYLIFISVFGLLMNIVVVIVIINDPQRMTPLNWMLFNLACSDGMIAGFGTPISAAAAFQYHWPFGDELCVAYAMIMSTAGIGSITTLTALAFSGSGGGSAKLGRVQAAILLTLIWIYSLAVTCPPLFGWGRYDREAAHISCSVNWESKMDNNRSYILYMFSFGLVVPFVVIVASYVSILRVVKKGRNVSPSYTGDGYVVSCVMGQATSPRQLVALRRYYFPKNAENSSCADAI